MNLAQFPRRRYTPWQTPIEKLSRFSETVGGPQIYMKRDDLLGLTGGGNKTRKLEFLVADAFAQGADTLITCGAIQSNHCRLTLAAAVKEGLKCRLVLEERVAGSYKTGASGNNMLYHLLGVESITVVPNGTDKMKAMEQVAAELVKLNRKPYIIPGGASNVIGSMGYIACAEEILAQAFDLGIKFDYVVTTSGSAGTQAGLLVGLYGNNADIPVVGINCSRAKAEQEQKVYDLAEELRVKMGVQCAIPRDKVLCFDEYIGPGYSLPTKEMINTVKLLARTEGILLDPVYTGKAMAGLVDLAKKRFFQPEDKVLFVHTGGSPALYAYTDVFLQ
ncbi:D-cysteine desulfhydrase [Acetonema longum]|uniref:D-cysteine desulfhydrase n=1 Tax=Acetonema longum DSM 6540 TaxID=1009370 RepID=F7NJ72_9FIRM|nr:D-cysteine desulfhydrase [Acetonema longum]EGO63919.1 D-cysteine desulfhydrase [Acetonema longum DSM 6540]